ncbi:MAG: FAD-dependent oxidoreductase [Aureliella sp.]
MKLSRRISVDVCIIGSGFAGSLLAWALVRRGWRVALVDRQSHPRFAIGESSTPLADLLLREIGQRYDLPEVLPLCTWGCWRESYPELRCGKKRGFSYFQHPSQSEFSESEDHDHSYMVAATATDSQSDTHWMRSDVDAWLFECVRQAGAAVFESAEVSRVSRESDAWRLLLSERDDPSEIGARFLVDSTGSGDLVARAVGLGQSDSLLTQTAAVFGHFRGVDSMSAVVGSPDDPFDADDAAQHHVLSNALWCWMLRFCDGTTSVGLTGPANQFASVKDAASAIRCWREQVERYPTLEQLLRRATLVDPKAGADPCLGWIPRISRLWNTAAGASWAMLPTTAGIIDPMHSTGIAHALSGVWRLLDMFSSTSRDGGFPSDVLQQYSDRVVEEVQWIDLLVALSHRAMKISMDVFVAASSFYFVAAVHCERSMATNARDGEAMPHGFLLASSSELRRITQEALKRLNSLSQSPTSAAQAQFVDWTREQLKPWNDFGLLDPECRNRIWRSTAEK